MSFLPLLLTNHFFLHFAVAHSSHTFTRAPVTNASRRERNFEETMAKSNNCQLSEPHVVSVYCLMGWVTPVELPLQHLMTLLLPCRLLPCHFMMSPIGERVHKQRANVKSDYQTSTLKERSSLAHASKPLSSAH